MTIDRNLQGIFASLTLTILQTKRNLHLIYISCGNDLEHGSSKEYPSTFYRRVKVEDITMSPAVTVTVRRVTVERLNVRTQEAQAEPTTLGIKVAGVSVPFQSER